jgi:hypothetical protein
VEFVVDKVALGQIFSEYFVSPLWSSTHLWGLAKTLQSGITLYISFHDHIIKGIKINRLRLAGHVLRRENKEIIKILVIVKPEGKRKKGRPRMRWVDGVEKDLKNLGVVNLRANAQERDSWRKFLEQANTHKLL